MTPEGLHNRLLALAEPAYRAFSASLLPGVDNILGVRIPELRKLAKEIAAGDWRAFLARAREDTYEETMVQGLAIGLAKGGSADILPYVAEFVPKIANWGVCDSFCAGLKLARREPEPVWGFLQPYFGAQGPYARRFALVMALDHYVDEAHIQAIFSLIDGMERADYYVGMAAAWALSVCFAHDPGRTLDYLLENSLDAFTFNKTISKILESYRVSAEDKETLRALRKAKALR